jgi:hypothetical protein
MLMEYYTNKNSFARRGRTAALIFCVSLFALSNSTPRCVQYCESHRGKNEKQMNQGDFSDRVSLFQKVKRLKANYLIKTRARLTAETRARIDTRGFLTRHASTIFNISHSQPLLNQKLFFTGVSH